jgi:MFS family permease
MQINKNIIALGWVSFFTDMSSSIVTTLLPIYVVYILHEGIDKLGIIIAIATFISYILRILFGYYSDKYNIVKPFVVIGYFISALTQPLLAFSSTFWGIAALRGTERMGKAIRSASKDTLISAYSKEKSHGKTFGFHKMMDIAGELTGALIIFIIFFFFAQNEIIIKDIFIWTIIPGVIATFIAWYFVQDVPRIKGEKNIVIQKADYHLFPLLFVYFGVSFFLINQQFLIIFAKQNGYILSDIPLFIILFTFIQTITSYYGGVLSDKIGSYKMLFISFIFGIFSIMSIKFNLWISFAFLGLFTVLSLNAIRSYISFHAKSKSFVFGIFYAGIAIASSLGSLAVGYIWHYFGFDTVFFLSLGGMVILTLICALLTAKK